VEEKTKSFTEKLAGKVLKNPIKRVKISDEYIQKSKERRKQIIEQKKTEKTMSKMEEKWKSIFPEQDKVNNNKKIAELSIGAPYILLLLKMLFSSDSIHIDDKTKKDKDKDKGKDKNKNKDKDEKNINPNENLIDD